MNNHCCACSVVCGHSFGPVFCERHGGGYMPLQHYNPVPQPSAELIRIARLEMLLDAMAIKIDQIDRRTRKDD